MCFANVEGGLEISLDKMKETDIVKILFAENPGIVIQISDKHKDEVKKILEDAGVGFIKLGKPTDERHILVNKEVLLSVRHWPYAWCGGILSSYLLGTQTVNERMC